MRVFFDTEFYENGRTIDLISIGMVREDGETFYAEAPMAKATADATLWLRENVAPHLKGKNYELSRDRIASSIIEFAGVKSEFWAYYAAYDWVLLCQLYGNMMKLPVGWPMMCMDVKQLCVSVGDPELPKQESSEHNALNDARWCKEAWEFLNAKG